MPWFVIWSFWSVFGPFWLDFAHVLTQNRPCLLSWVSDHSSSFVRSFMDRLGEPLCLGLLFGRFGPFLGRFGSILLVS